MTEPANEVAPTPRLQMRGVRKRFGATVALDGVDLAVAAGEVHALVGENGAGKSTLMKVLSGALQADAGEMWLDGRPYRPRGPQAARAAGVAMIYQELSLAPHLSVQDNILLGMEPTRLGRLDRAAMRRRSRDALEQLGHTEIDPRQRVRDLPIGSRQIVEIARAVAVGCGVLVLDEPTSSLGREDVRRLFALVARLRRQGHAIVYISHFLEEVKDISDRFSILRDGKVVGAGRTAEHSVAGIARVMVGGQVEERFHHAARAPGEPLLELRDLAGRRKPESASLTLHRGEVFGIAGLVGAGRTELLRAIFGLDPVRRGLIRLGVFVGAAAPARRWRQGAGMLSEDRKAEGLALGLSVTDNLTLSKLPFFVQPRRQAAAARAWAQRLGIRCRQVAQPVIELSGGNQQKVALARLLHHDAEVWLLDEPTRGIDVGSKAEIYRLIDELAGRGKAVLMVSSYFPELLGVCDRVAVMCRGRLGAARPVADCDEHALMLEASGAGAAG
jgi:ribose transport system ATP-binding protein